MRGDNDELRHKIGLAAGLAAFAAILLAPVPQGMTPEAKSMAAIATLMAIWWISEALHIAVTALLPVALCPLLGVIPASQVAPYYASHIVFLFIGGFIIALAMEKWNLHRRIALETIVRFGARPERIVLGFMVATAFLSMWISNTATTMMMLPIAIAVVGQLAGLAAIDGERGGETEEVVRRNFGLTLLLAIAYSASIGGIGTIIGSPTTVAFLGFVHERFPGEPPVTFVDWSLVCVPIILVFLPISWLYLCRYAGPIALRRIQFQGSADVIRAELRKLGPMSAPERRVLAVASMTAFLWIFRSPIELGAVRIPGWSRWFSNPSDLHDSTVAMAMGLLLCLLPAHARGKQGQQGPRERFLMDWPTIERGVPWSIVFLLGGGFALAAGIEGSGLAEWMGSQLGALKGTPVWILVPAACLLAALLTETTSNVATVLMLSPVLAATALEIGVHPYLLLIPTAVMASFAFMLPVATPPNAIVFSSGWITIPQMFRAGFVLDAIALVVVPLVVYLIGSLRFPFSG